MSSNGDPVAEAWEQVMAQWEEPQAHKRFISLCATLDRLPEAGKRYRRVRDDAEDEERRAQAEMHIDELFGVAMSSLEALKSTPSEKGKNRILWVAVGLVVVLVGSMAWAVLRTG